MRIVASAAFLSAATMPISDAISQLQPPQGITSVSQTTHGSSLAGLQCKPVKDGDTLKFPYTITNDGPVDIFVADAFTRVDPTTHAASADPSIVVIALEADGFAMILRGLPPLPPFDVTRPVLPLLHRVRKSQSLERHLDVPLPLAETSPYQPYGNLRDYTLKPIEGVVLAIDILPATAEGLVTTPASYAPGLLTFHSTNYVRDMQRISCRFPTKGLSILARKTP